MLTVALASDPLRMSGPRPFRLRGSYHHCEAIVDWMMNWLQRMRVMCDGRGRILEVSGGADHG